MVNWHSREAQPERRATMKRKIYFIVSQVFFTGLLIASSAGLLAPHSTAVLISLMPFFPIWGSFLMFQLTFQEIKKNGLRVLSYGLSVFLFVIYFLSFLGVIPFTRIEGNISAIHYRSLRAATYVDYGLLVVNAGFLVRDSYVSDREKGRL